jgi:hypothetical protein
LGGGNADTKLAIWEGGSSAVMGFGVGPDQFRVHLANSGNRFSFLDAPAGNEIVTIQGNGNVGIGTSSPWHKLHVTTGGSIAIYGVNTANSTENQTIGVWGEIANERGAAVVGYVTATGGVNYGGYFRSYSTSGIGLFGWATATSGVTAGVLGRTESSSGWGVYCQGPFGATGLKLFQIDHPLQPETHFLNHFCTEGPDPYNVYRGNVTTDANGYATITLPPYFESINRDPTYHLTIVGGAGEEFVQVRVVREIQNNQFVIRTSKPYVKVSWRVEAIRNDRWVQEHGYQPEQEKPKEYQGKYLNPELYGQPKERGIFYHPELERPREGEKPR